MLFYENPNGKLYHGDCLEIMKDIPDGSVDMVLCDLPYGMTACDWDVVIPFEPLWEHYNRICKRNAAVVLFSQQPFTTDIINSNRKKFRYEIIYRKTMKMGFLNAHKMPLKGHENICVFYKALPTYNPQKTQSRNRPRIRVQEDARCGIYSKFKGGVMVDDGSRYPESVIDFSNFNGGGFVKNRERTKHPTQKPVPLLEYLIRTYSNEKETILDNCIGSGSTAVAAENTGRRWIGIEKEEHFCEVAKKRIAEAAAQGRLLLLQG